MSHFECRLNQRFWRSKKVVQSVQIGGRGEVIWTKSKRTATFFVKLSLSQFNQTMPTPVPPSIVCANFDQVKCQVSSIMCDGQYDQLAAGWSAVVK